MRRPLCVLVGVLVLVLVVAGCGGSTPSVTSATTASAATATAAPTIAATAPATSASASTTAAPPGTDVVTFGGTATRQGTVPAGPAPPGIHEAWTSPELDGLVYGAVLVFDGHVLVATEGDSVYALVQGSGQVAWTTNLGDPVAGSSLPCGNIDPSGITGTPVLDPATGTLYVVAFVRPGQHDLAALDAATGAVRWRRTVDPPGLSPLVEQERAALTIANGRVYVAFGGLYGDCGPYKGAVVSSALDGQGDLQSWEVPTAREGGLWAPSGPAVDEAGNLYAAVGNAASTTSGTFDYGNSVVRLGPDLALADFWAPKDFAQLSATDTDLGSQGPVLLDSGLLFVAGKDGKGYVLDRARLGGIAGERAQAKVCSGGAFGGTAASGNQLVVGCSGGPAGVRVGADGALTVAWQASGQRSGAPVIAGSSAWLIEANGHLLALDVATGAVQADVDLGGATKGFPTPTVTPTAVYTIGHAHVAAFAA